MGSESLAASTGHPLLELGLASHWWFLNGVSSQFWLGMACGHSPVACRKDASSQQASPFLGSLKVPNPNLRNGNSVLNSWRHLRSCLGVLLMAAHDAAPSLKVRHYASLQLLNH